MPEMEPLEEEAFDTEDASSHDSNEHNARSFFAMLCFFIAFIFLITFINNSPGSISGLFVLFGIFIFGLGGVYLLSYAKARKPGTGSSFTSQRPGPWEGANETTIIDSTLVNTEDEDEGEQETGELTP